MEETVKIKKYICKKKKRLVHIFVRILLSNTLPFTKSPSFYGINSLFSITNLILSNNNAATFKFKIVLNCHGYLGVFN